MCRKALEVCQRDEEKTLVLEVLELNPAAQSLSLAVSLVKQASLKDEAGQCGGRHRGESRRGATRPRWLTP